MSDDIFDGVKSVKGFFESNDVLYVLRITGCIITAASFLYFELNSNKKPQPMRYGMLMLGYGSFSALTVMNLSWRWSGLFLSGDPARLLIKPDGPEVWSLMRTILVIRYCEGVAQFLYYIPMVRRWSTYYFMHRRNCYLNRFRDILEQ